MSAVFPNHTQCKSDHEQLNWIRLHDYDHWPESYCPCKSALQYNSMRIQLGHNGGFQHTLLVIKWEKVGVLQTETKIPRSYICHSTDSRQAIYMVPSRCPASFLIGAVSLKHHKHQVGNSSPPMVIKNGLYERTILRQGLYNHWLI